mmetsp:Transcript_330/g.1155  ORF Transcript_330/g.1155 Transcript_330/m.1155 type:complete len:217 (-) Transcript_330:696-1346(-)
MERYVSRKVLSSVGSGDFGLVTFSTSFSSVQALMLLLSKIMYVGSSGLPKGVFSVGHVRRCMTSCTRGFCGTCGLGGAMGLGFLGATGRLPGPRTVTWGMPGVVTSGKAIPPAGLGGMGSGASITTLPWEPGFGGTGSGWSIATLPCEPGFGGTGSGTACAAAGEPGGEGRGIAVAPGGVRSGTAVAPGGVGSGIAVAPGGVGSGMLVASGVVGSG